MDLIEYRDSIPGSERDVWADLADELGSSKAYISQIAHGHRRPSPEMCIRIERATDGQVTRQRLRPDIWSSEQSAA